MKIWKLIHLISFTLFSTFFLLHFSLFCSTSLFSYSEVPKVHFLKLYLHIYPCSLFLGVKYYEHISCEVRSSGNRLKGRLYDVYILKLSLSLVDWCKSIDSWKCSSYFISQAYTRLREIIGYSVSYKSLQIFVEKRKRNPRSQIWIEKASPDSF